jgi:hypothetical protein
MKKNGYIPLSEIMQNYDITENELIDLKIVRQNNDLDNIRAVIDNDGYKYLILGHHEVIFVKEKQLMGMLAALKKTVLLKNLNQDSNLNQPSSLFEGLGFSLLIWILLLGSISSFVHYNNTYPAETKSFIFNSLALAASLFVSYKIYQNGIIKFLNDVKDAIVKFLYYCTLITIFLLFISIASIVFDVGTSSTSICFYRVGCIN